MKTFTKVTVILSAVTVAVGYALLILNVFSLIKLKKKEKVIGD